jgi:phospholipid/cholesterol/gamma-HCH transport system substrate-binding protein
MSAARTQRGTRPARRVPSQAWFKTRRRLIGVVFLAVLGSLIWLAVAIFNKQFTRSTMVTLYTDSTGNQMNLNADVMIRGVVVGQVRSITASGTGAELGLAIQPAMAQELPANVTAQMLPTTLFGERYVALILPAARSAQTLAQVHVIRQDRSADAIELEKVLNDLEPMLTAVQPQSLSVTLTAIADSLQGRGAELGQTLDEINSYLRQFDPQLPALDNDIRELVAVTQTYTQAAPSIVAALRDYSVTSQTIASEAANLSSLYSTVTSASQNLTSFLHTNSSDIISLSDVSVPTLQVLARYSAEFPCVFTDLADFVPAVNKVLGGTGPEGTGPASQPGLHITIYAVDSLGPYRPGVDTPKYGDDLGPHCYPVPFPGIELNDGASPPSGVVPLSEQVPAAGLGLANSPQENELINELASPQVGQPPAKLPSWSSVLLGPLYRGTTVNVG